MIARIALFSGLFLIGCGGATLGSSGTDAADGGTHLDSGTASDGCTSTCLASDLTWASNGGLVSASSSSTLSNCSSAFRYGESSSSGDLSCTDTLLSDCPDAANVITAGDVAGAFFDPDVTAAFAGSTKIYGSDPRGCDGSVLDITYDGKTIEVGGDCSNAGACGGPKTGCIDVPDGLQALATLLEDLDGQEIKTKSCASVFPGR